jgi:hypothetical protein
MRINEMRYDGKSTGLFSEEEDDYTYMTPTQKDFTGQDMIGDGDDDDLDKPYFMEMEEDDDYFEEYEGDIDLSDEDVDDDIIEPLQEQVNKTLDMFKRFKNY